MKALRFNADYETDLFFSNKAPAILNESLECILFFLTERPILTQKKYHPDYLDYVERMTGHRPVLVTQGEFENYWGLLQNRDLEKWWNSKITTAELIINMGWCENTFIVKDVSELREIKFDRDFLLKDPFGMSGQKFQILSSKMMEQERIVIANKALRNGPFILEPLLNRKYDFSQYIFPDNKKIAYQNIVDDKFQYKGTSFSHYTKATIEELPFFDLIDTKTWSQFEEQTNRIINFFSKHPNESGYSIDSFVYEENGILKIRVLSEINYRKTMGRLCFDLAQGFGFQRPWANLFLKKKSTSKIPTRTTLESLELKKDSTSGVIVLNPEDTRYDLFFLSAINTQEAKNLRLEIDRLLTNC
jgi:hypothetical protein